MIDDNLTRERVAALIAGDRWPYAVAVLWAWCRDERTVEDRLVSEPALLWGDPNESLDPRHPELVNWCIGGPLWDLQDAVRESQKMEVAAGALLQTDTVDYAIAKEKEAQKLAAALGRDRATSELACRNPWDLLQVALQRGEVVAYGVPGEVFGNGRNFDGKSELIPATAWGRLDFDMNKALPGCLLLAPKGWQFSDLSSDIYMWGWVTFDAVSLRRALPSAGVDLPFPPYRQDETIQGWVQDCDVLAFAQRSVTSKRPGDRGYKTALHKQLALMSGGVIDQDTIGKTLREWGYRYQ